MLIERISKKILNHILPGGAGEIFYINEHDMDFCDKGSPFWGKAFDDIPLPQWLPYESFLLHFKDSLVSYKTVKINCKDPKCTCGDTGVLVDYFGCNQSGKLGFMVPNGDMILYRFDKSLTLSDMKRVNRYSQEQSDITWESYGLPDFTYCLFYYLLYNFLSFLTCKNIKIETVMPTKKQQRNRRKKGKPPKASYHILQLKSISRASLDSDNQGLWSNRIHLCRGHVREYVPDRPLFGKYSGKFWIPPHARGERRLGTVQKDYALST